MLMYELELYSLTASVLPDSVGFLQVFLLKLLPERLLSQDRYREYRILPLRRPVFLSRHYRHGVLLSIKSYNQEVTFTFNVHF